MTEFSFSTEFFIYVLDLFGTVAFAITGAFKAIEKKFDVVGILLLATITGVAGGTIRDVVLGRVPNSIVDQAYVIATIASGIVIFSILLYFTEEIYVATIIGIILTTALRLIAIKYNWNLPKVKNTDS